MNWKTIVKLAVIAAGAFVTIGCRSHTPLVRPGKNNFQARAVRAEQFVLEDNRGQVRAIFGVNPEGATMLTMMDRRGRPGIALYVSEQKDGMAIQDGAGRERIQLERTPTGSAIGLKDRHGVFRASLMELENASVLYLYDEQGNPRIAMSLDEMRRTLSFLDEQGKPRIEMSIDEMGRTLSFLKEDMSPQAKLGFVDEKFYRSVSEVLKEEGIPEQYFPDISSRVGLWLMDMEGQERVKMEVDDKGKVKTEGVDQGVE